MVNHLDKVTDQTILTLYEVCETKIAIKFGSIIKDKLYAYEQRDKQQFACTR